MLIPHKSTKEAPNATLYRRILLVFNTSGSAGVRRDKDELRSLSPVLDEMLMILEASYVLNGEIELDYTRFRVLLDEARSGLGRLGIQLPNLNEGGDGAIFRETLRRIGYHARIGDVAGARRTQRPVRKTSVQSSPKNASDWAAVLGMGALGLVLGAILLLIAAQILWSSGSWVVNSFREPTPYPTFTALEKCMVFPDGCYADYQIAQDEYWERMAEDDMRWAAMEYERHMADER